MKFFRGTRWLPILAGGMLALLGFVCTLYPGVMADLFPLLAGVCVLALGLGEGAFGFTLRKTGGDGGPLLLQGVVNVAVGCVLLLNQNVSKVFIAVLLAIWVFVAGVLRARTAWRLARRGRRWGAVAVDAFVKCALGVVCLLYTSRAGRTERRRRGAGGHGGLRDGRERAGPAVRLPHFIQAQALSYGKAW